jgi:signal peptidase II
MGFDARRVWPLAAVAGAVLGIDQAAKYAVKKFTEPGAMHELIPGLLNFVRTTNPGVAFGILAESRAHWRTPLLIAVSIAVICFIIWLIATGRAGGALGQYGVAFVLGGAAGNLYDRVVHESVTDFIDFHIGAYHWYTFNVADSAIVLGAGLIVLELLRDWRHPHRKSHPGHA